MKQMPLSDGDTRQDAPRWQPYRRPQRERLAHVARLLMRDGWVSRAALCAAFEISTAQASLDLKIVRGLLPDGLEYCTATKAWRHPDKARGAA